MVLLFGEQGRLLEVASFGDEQFDWIPPGRALQPILLRLLRCEYNRNGRCDVLVSEAKEVDLSVGKVTDEVDIVGVLRELLDANSGRAATGG